MKFDNKIINVCDIGGRYGFHRSWENFILPVNYYCFDADPEEVERLKRQNEGAINSKPIQIIAGAVAEKVGTAPFYLYSFRAASSLYELNTTSTYRYGKVKLDQKINVETINLDAFLDQEKAVPHFVSIDAQGASLQILRGGEFALQGCLGLRCELEFFQLYKKAPLAGEVMEYLQSRKFRLLRLEMCGPGLYGVSTEMNEFSVSPWDAKPSSCDSIWANEMLIEKLMTSPIDQTNAIQLGYFIAFCIYNGSGYYGLELIQRLHKNNLLNETLRSLEEKFEKNLISLCNLYLSITRQKVSTQFGENLNQLFSGDAIAVKLFGNSNYEIDPIIEQKIRKVYQQRYEV